MGGAARHPRRARRAVPHPQRRGADLSLRRPTGGATPDGTVPSPNIWHHTATYELENRAFDRGGLVTAALREVADWTGRDVLDLGCGSGYHLPLWAADARSVIGVEPHPDLLALARRRTRRLAHVELRQGTAQATGLPDASVDVVQVRWAYFFGPGCEPGLTELERVVRPGGVAAVIDNDASTSTFGQWFRKGFPKVDPDRVARFWRARGWTSTPVLTSWEFDSRADLEAVARIELPTRVAEEFCARHRGTVVDYAIHVWWKRF